MEGDKGVNPVVYAWKNGNPQRKNIEQARQLLAEAGYPRGVDVNTGKPLLLNFDTSGSGPDSMELFVWLRKQF